MPAPTLRRSPSTLCQSVLRIPADHPSRLQSTPSKLHSQGLTIPQWRTDPKWLPAFKLFPPNDAVSVGPVARTKYDIPKNYHLIGGLPFRKFPKTKKVGSTRALENKKFRPVPIVYREDFIRKNFFRDFPYEGYRAKTLVEGDYVGEFGLKSHRWVDVEEGTLEWKSLKDITTKPLPEDCVAYTLALYDRTIAAYGHRKSGLAMKRIPAKLLNACYRHATTEYSFLQSSHAISTQYACIEAQSYGAVIENIRGNVIKRYVNNEKKQLKRWMDNDWKAEHGLAGEEKYEILQKKMAFISPEPNELQMDLRKEWHGDWSDAMGGGYLYRSETGGMPANKAEEWKEKQVKKMRGREIRLKQINEGKGDIERYEPFRLGMHRSGDDEEIAWKKMQKQLRIELGLGPDDDGIKDIQGIVQKKDGEIWMIDDVKAKGKQKPSDSVSEQKPTSHSPSNKIQSQPNVTSTLDTSPSRYSTSTSATPTSSQTVSSPPPPKSQPSRPSDLIFGDTDMSQFSLDDLDLSSNSREPDPPKTKETIDAVPVKGDAGAPDPEGYEGMWGGSGGWGDGEENEWDETGKRKSRS